MKRIRNVNTVFLFLVAASLLVPRIFGSFLSGLTIHQLMIINEVIFVGVALLLILPADRGLIGEIQQERLRGRTVAMVILFGLLVQPVSMWLNLFSQLFVTNYVAETMSGLGNSLLFNLLYVAVAPALAEEFIFRGLLYHGYRRMGVLKAAALTGLLFGLLHMNLNQFVYAFALGVLLALLMEAAGSIYASMIVHFMINGRSVLLLAVSQQMGGSTAGTQEISRTVILQALLVYTPIALACAAGMFFLIRRIAKECGRGEFFDLVLQGQEQTVRRGACGSEEAVRQSAEKMRQSAAEVLEEYEAAEQASKKQEQGWSPAERASRFVPEPDETFLQAGRKEKLLAALPALIGAAACIIYMFIIERG